MNSKGKKTKTTKTVNSNLVAGRFREKSDLAKMYELLADGKPRTKGEINKVVRAEVPANIMTGKYMALRRFGQETGKFTLTKANGTLTMVRGRRKAA